MMSVMHMGEALSKKCLPDRASLSMEVWIGVDKIGKNLCIVLDTSRAQDELYKAGERSLVQH